MLVLTLPLTFGTLMVAVVAAAGGAAALRRDAARRPRAPQVALA